jgi:hypothetical protein
MPRLDLPRSPRLPWQTEHAAVIDWPVNQKDGKAYMNTNLVLWLQGYIIGVLVFLISITAITEHPEWFN